MQRMLWAIVLCALTVNARALTHFIHAHDIADGEGNILGSGDRQNEIHR